MRIDIHKEVEIESTIRTELLSSMFEVPAKQKLSVTLTGDLPNDLLSGNRHPNEPWNIGLIVGPSGSGKTLLLNELFNPPVQLEWRARSVIDDFESSHSMEDISRICQAVGFNTIPSWLRPYSVLSNGERFRVEVSRHLLRGGIITIDEFTSVVDRQVAQFACHSIQKYIREKQKRLVAASCHYDIIDWLQPDWILEPGNPCRFTWRSLRGRPPINVSVSRVKYETWQLFKDFHYMSQDLNKAARCYGLYVRSTNSTKRTDGVEVRLHDDEIYPSKNRSHCDLGDGNGTRLPSSGYHGSSGDGEENSRLLVRDARRDGTYEHRDGSTERYVDSAGITKSPSEIIQSSSLSTNETESLHKPLRSGNIPDAENSRLPNRRSSIFGQSNNETYRIASMCGVLYRPHPKVSDICGFTRMVTLPDFQGLGLAFVLACKVASAYKALGKRLHSYPNHPAWIRSYQRSSLWMQIKDSGSYSPRRGSTSTVGGFGNKRCAVFCYIGDAMNREEAERLINGD